MNVTSAWKISGISSVSSGSSTVQSRTAKASRRSDLVLFHLSASKLRTRLQDIRTELLDIRGAVGTKRRAKVPSTQSVDLVTEIEYTTLTSTEELNTTPTSYDGIWPEFSGWSSSQPTILGEYDGRYGDDTLIFKVKRSRWVGWNKSIKIDVYTQSDGKKVDTLKWSAWAPAGTTDTEKSGLEVSLGSGFVLKNDTFTVDVYDSVGTDVDENVSFESPASWVEGTISDGSFDVDGITIDVYSDDTLQDVMDRINANATHLTVTLENDKLTFTRNTADSEDIVLDNDSSGFLDVMKLSSAEADLGTAGTGTEETLIKDVEDLDSVTNGTLTINGTAIAIDVDTMSLGDVVDAINDDVAGVKASLDVEAGEILLRTHGNVRNITIDDDTGLMAAFGIENKTTYGAFGGGLPNKLRREIVELMVDLSAHLKAFGSAGGDTPDSYRSALNEGVDLHTDDDGWFDFGLDFDTDAEDGDILSVDTDALYKALAKDPGDVLDVLVGEDGTKAVGLIGTMDTVLGGIETQLAAEHGATGLVLSLAA